MSYLRHTLYKALHALKDLKARIGWHFDFFVLRSQQGAARKHKIGEVIVQKLLYRNRTENPHVIDDKSLEKRSDVDRWLRLPRYQRPDSDLFLLETNSFLYPA